MSLKFIRMATSKRQAVLAELKVVQSNKEASHLWYLLPLGTSLQKRSFSL